MTKTSVTPQSSKQAIDKNSIRPFLVDVPDAELAEIAQAHQRDKVA